MIGLKMTLRTFNQLLSATKTAPAGGDFVWDVQDEDERPLSKDEMVSGIAAARKRRSRPAGSGTKELVAIRLDHNDLAAFRTGSPGWQTRMNEALKDWLRTHSAV